MNWKGIARRALSGRWPRRGDFKPGYTILLPTPADMPFLLELALETVVGWLSPERLLELANEAVELYVWDRIGSDN